MLKKLKIDWKKIKLFRLFNGIKIVLEEIIEFINELREELEKLKKEQSKKTKETKKE